MGDAAAAAVPCHQERAGPPQYWGTGVAALLFDEMVRRAIPKGYQWADLSLTSEDNPNTPMLAETMGARVYKRYRVYRYCF